MSRNSMGVMEFNPPLPPKKENAQKKILHSTTHSFYPTKVNRRPTVSLPTVRLRKEELKKK